MRSYARRTISITEGTEGVWFHCTSFQSFFLAMNIFKTVDKNWDRQSHGIALASSSSGKQPQKPEDPLVELLNDISHMSFEMTDCIIQSSATQGN